MATAVTFALGLLLALAGLALSPRIASDPEVVAQLRRLFLCLPFLMPSLVWIASLQPHHIHTWSFVRVLQPLSYFLLVSGLFLTGTLTMVSAVTGLIVSLGIQIVVSGYQSWRLVGFGRALGRREGMPVVLYGLKTTLTYLPHLVNERLDKLVLSVMVGAAALGNYAVAVSLASLALPVGHAFGAVIFPRIAAATHRHQQIRVERVALLGTAVGASLILVPMAVAAPWMIPWLFGQGFDEAVPLLWFLVPGTLALTLNVVGVEVLNGQGRPLAAALSQGVGAVLTVVLLALLVPPLGIEGAAIASLFAYLGVNIVIYFMRRSPGFLGSDLVIKDDDDPLGDDRDSAAVEEVGLPRLPS